MKGKLFVCPTPIGNLDDITFRTIKVLKEVDKIAAEDTRHTIKLLNHLDIKKPLTSYHEFNKDSKGKSLIEDLLSGENIALVSDAGMPGISDPGEDIIKLCIEENINVEVLPGASAFVIALVGSGMSTRRFAFEGFLDRNKKEKKKRLDELKYEKRTVIYYESPHRIKDTLKLMSEILGNRNISICRELTKKYEEYQRTTIDEALDYFKENDPRGEYILVVEGFDGEIVSLENSGLDSLSNKDYVLDLISQGYSKKDAIKMVAKNRGLKKDIVYKECIDL